MNNNNTNTTIYTAIRSFMDADKAKSNGWGTLSLGLASLTASEAEARCEEAAADFKRNNKGALPSTYRSAKAVALKALRLGVALLGPDGQPIGKSAIEKLCKEKQDALDNAELARIKASETESGSLVCAEGDAFRERFAALILAARTSGFDAAELFAAAMEQVTALDAE